MSIFIKHRGKKIYKENSENVIKNLLLTLLNHTALCSSCDPSRNKTVAFCIIDQ